MTYVEFTEDLFKCVAALRLSLIIPLHIFLVLFDSSRQCSTLNKHKTFRKWSEMLTMARDRLR